MSSTIKSCIEAAVNQYLTECQGKLTAGLYTTVMLEAEQSLIRTVMAHTEGNQTAAAEILGISRTTLRNKLKLIERV